MLNYETILSNYDDKLTLMQWLKKVEAALENASATAFHVNKRGDATLTFSIDFADGTQIESEPIVLQQGESVVSCRIANGHLLLTLSNGDVLDAGVILSGNLNVNGNISVSNNIETEFLNVRDTATLESAEITGSASVGGGLDVGGNAGVTGDLSVGGIVRDHWKEIPLYIRGTSEGLTVNETYVRALYDGKSLHIIVNFSLTNPTAAAITPYVVFQSLLTLPSDIASRIIDNEGHSVASTDATDFAGITMSELYMSPSSKYTGSDTGMALCIHNSRNVNIIYVRARPHSGGSFSIAAGATAYFTGRVILTF